jgi:hypothetical protein
VDFNFQRATIQHDRFQPIYNTVYSSSSIVKPTWCTFHSILLKIKGIYMFRALLDHSQEAVYKQHLVYCVHVIVCMTLHARNIPSAVCVAPPEDEQTAIVAQPPDIIRKQYTKCRCVAPPEDEQTAIVARPTDIRPQYTKCHLCNASWGWVRNSRNMYRPLILNKIEWKVHHVGFIILIYYDLRSAKH